MQAYKRVEIAGVLYTPELASVKESLRAVLSRERSSPNLLFAIIALYNAIRVTFGSSSEFPLMDKLQWSWAVAFLVWLAPLCWLLPSSNRVRSLIWLTLFYLVTGHYHTTSWNSLLENTWLPFKVMSLHAHLIGAWSWRSIYRIPLVWALLGSISYQLGFLFFCSFFDHPIMAWSLFLFDISRRLIGSFVTYKVTNIPVPNSLDVKYCKVCKKVTSRKHHICSKVFSPLELHQARLGDLEITRYLLEALLRTVHKRAQNPYMSYLRSAKTQAKIAGRIPRVLSVLRMNPQASPHSISTEVELLYHIDPDYRQLVQLEYNRVISVLTGSQIFDKKLLVAAGV